MNPYRAHITSSQVNNHYQHSFLTKCKRLYLKLKIKRNSWRSRFVRCCYCSKSFKRFDKNISPNNFPCHICVKSFIKDVYSQCFDRYFSRKAFHYNDECEYCKRSFDMDKPLDNNEPNWFKGPYQEKIDIIRSDVGMNKLIGFLK